MPLRRRSFVALAGASAALPARAEIARSEIARADVLRLVPSTDLAFLDPVFASALVSVEHGYHVFDTLFGVDAALQPQPQMAESAETAPDGLAWTIRLRPGLLFHDGQPVTARDCTASLQRWGRRDTVGRVAAAYTDGFDVLDDRTFRVRLHKPFPRLLNAYGKPHIAPAFIMPERVAQTPADQPIREMVGSGPYRFLPGEWVPGSFVAYARFDGYVPRPEPAAWTSGGKVAHFPRVEWHVIPDQSTAVAALQNGEVDWMESVSADLLPLIRSDPALRTQHDDPFGKLLIMRFNHLQPPFDDVRMRRFVMELVKQSDYGSSLNGGDPGLSQDCFSGMPCTLPGVAPVARGDFERLHGQSGQIAAALRETGYAGQKIVILNASDSLVIAPLGRITADLLTRAGLNVDLQEMDFGTLLKRLASQAPAGEGGWSVYHTAWPSVSIADPMQNLTLRGEGRRGYVGWYESADMERLVSQWIEATSTEARADLQMRIQLLARNDLPSLPLGMFLSNMAYRADLQGVLSGNVRYPWNVRRTRA